MTEEIAMDIVDLLAIVLRGDSTKSITINDEFGLKIEYPNKPIKKKVIMFGGIEWLVLEVQSDKRLLLMKDVHVPIKYHDDFFRDITWNKCSLRNEFLVRFYDNFIDPDWSQIIKVNNKNEDNQWYGTSGGANTSDYIFLLSISEVVKYFGDSGQLSNKNHGTKLDINDRYNFNRIAEYQMADCGWWLRSPGRSGNYASYVDNLGHINISGSSVNSDLTAGVRPALWQKFKTNLEVTNREAYYKAIDARFR